MKMVDHLIPAIAIVGVLGACSSNKDNTADGGTSGATSTGGTTAGTGGAAAGTGGAAASTGGTSGASSGGAAADTGGTTGASTGGTAGTSTGGTTGDGGPGTGGADGGGTAPGPGTPGWTAITLLDDMTDPSNVLSRAGVDLVSAIYFASLDDGWVATRQGDNSDVATGGAIFKAKATSLTSILFSGNRDGTCFVSAGGGIDFQGFDKSPTGLVALAYGCDVIQSTDNGKTFALEKNQASDQLGIEPILAMRPIPSGGTLIASDNYFDSSPTPPGPTADWTTIWAAPPASPTTPDPLPDKDCQETPLVSVPPVKTAVYVSPKADLLAYVAHSDDLGPIVCVSKGSVTDGGIENARNFLPRTLPGIPDDATFAAPNGVTFMSDTVGIAFWANNLYPGESYIYRTTNAGDTWKSVALPAAVAKKAIEFQSVFFAPDGLHGWIVGYNYDSSAPLVIHTADGGVTWDANQGDLTAKALAGGGLGKLYDGFALDASHIWVGGDSGILMQNSAGGI
jgi:hypothetical protein